MFKFTLIMGAALVALPLTVSSAAAFDKDPSRFNSWRTGAALVEQGTHRTPGGLMRLCNARPELCPEYRTRFEVGKVVRTLQRTAGAAAAAPQRQFIDRARLRQLREVNETVNRMIRPVHDRGRDDWQLSSSHGDCEEYVLMKREVLASLGWSRSAMRIAAAKTQRGVDHAVLIIKGEFEDLVLDNLTDEVLGIGATTHTYTAVESSHQPGRWSRVAARPAPVASARALFTADTRAQRNSRPAAAAPRARSGKAAHRVVRR